MAKLDKKETAIKKMEEENEEALEFMQTQDKQLEQKSDQIIDLNAKLAAAQTELVSTQQQVAALNLQLNRRKTTAAT